MKSYMSLFTNQMVAVAQKQNKNNQANKEIKKQTKNSWTIWHSHFIKFAFKGFNSLLL